MLQSPIPADERSASATPSEQEPACATESTNPVVASLAAALAALREQSGNIPQTGLVIALDEAAAETLGAWGLPVASGSGWQHLNGAGWQQLSALLGWEVMRPAESAVSTSETTTDDGEAAHQSGEETASETTPQARSASVPNAELAAECVTPNEQTLPTNPPTAPEAITTEGAAIAETSPAAIDPATQVDASTLPTPAEASESPSRGVTGLVTNVPPSDAPTDCGDSAEPTPQPDPPRSPPHYDVVLVGWSPQHLSTEQPAPLRSTVRRLRQLEEYLGADLTNIAVWLPGPAELDGIRFCIECGDLDDVRRAVRASLDVSRYVLDAVPLDDATPADAADEHSTALRRAETAARSSDCTETERAEAERELAASSERNFVAPLRAQAFRQSNEWDRILTAMAAETAAQFYRTSSRLTAAQNTAAERQQSTGDLLRYAAQFCKLARESRS